MATKVTHEHKHMSDRFAILKAITPEYAIYDACERVNGIIKVINSNFRRTSTLFLDDYKAL